MTPFRIQSKGGRYWLCDPQGSPMRLFTVNHVGEVNFENYPKLKEKYGDHDTMARAVAGRLKEWGFNAVGYGASDVYHPHIPYLLSFQFLNHSHWRSGHDFAYADIFDSRFQASVDATLREACTRHRDSENLVGYFWTDTPTWNLDKARLVRASDWVTFYRRLPQTATGKQQYCAFLQEKYQGNIEAFNRAYRLKLRQFEDILAHPFDGLELNLAGVRRDDEAFLGIIAETFYRFLYERTKAYDPNHLIFGERYKLHDYTEAVLQSAGRYVDVISIQPGPTTGPLPGQGNDEAEFNAQHYDELHRITQKPIFVCDHQVSFKTERHPVTLWHQFPSEAEAADSVSRYIIESQKKPYIIGYGRCQYFDKWDEQRQLLKQGLVSADDSPHTQLVKTISETLTSSKA